MLLAEWQGLGTTAADYATAAATFSELQKISNLQQALTRLSSAAKWLDVNPGRTDGTLDYQTMAAIAAALRRIPKIPDYVKTALSIAAAASAFGIPDSVRSTVVQYADTVASAANALAVTYQLSAGSAPPASQAPGVSTIAPASLPSGSIQAQIKGQWHTAVPKGAQLNGAGLAGVQLDGPTHQEAYVTPSPTSATKVDAPIYNKAVGRFWTQWWFWAAAGIAGTAVIVVPIVVVSARRRRRRR